MYKSLSTFPFQSLPYLIRQRFSEIAHSQSASKFFQLSKNTTSLSKNRTFINDLQICFAGSFIVLVDQNEVWKKADQVVMMIKKFEVLNKLTLMNLRNLSPSDLLPYLPSSFSILFINCECVKFFTFKALLEYECLKEIKFYGTINLEEKEFSLKELQEFFDRLSKIRKIRLTLTSIAGSAKNQTKFIKVAEEFDAQLKMVKKSGAVVIFTRKVYRRTIHDL